HLDLDQNPLVDYFVTFGGSATDAGFFRVFSPGTAAGMDSLWLIAYLVLAGAAVVQGLLVAINVYEHRRRALVRLKKISYYAPTGRVLVLSPCKGFEINLEENLRALLNQDYPDYEVTFIVEDASDAACPVIHRAI